MIKGYCKDCNNSDRIYERQGIIYCMDCNKELDLNPIIYVQYNKLTKEFIGYNMWDAGYPHVSDDIKDAKKYYNKQECQEALDNFVKSITFKDYNGFEVIDINNLS